MRVHYHAVVKNTVLPKFPQNYLLSLTCNFKNKYLFSNSILRYIQGEGSISDGVASRSWSQLHTEFFRFSSKKGPIFLQLYRSRFLNSRRFVTCHTRFITSWFSRSIHIPLALWIVRFPMHYFKTKYVSQFLNYECCEFTTIVSLKCTGCSDYAESIHETICHFIHRSQPWKVLSCLHDDELS